MVRAALTSAGGTLTEDQGEAQALNLALLDLKLMCKPDGQPRWCGMRCRGQDSTAHFPTVGLVIQPPEASVSSIGKWRKKTSRAVVEITSGL